MRLQQVVPPTCLRVEEDADLLQRHAGRLVPQDDGDADQVLTAVTTVTGGVAFRSDQAQGLPVAQHVRGQVEPAGQLADGPGADDALAFMLT